MKRERGNMWIFVTWFEWIIQEYSLNCLQMNAEIFLVINNRGIVGLQLDRIMADYLGSLSASRFASQYFHIHIYLFDFCPRVASCFFYNAALRGVIKTRRSCHHYHYHTDPGHYIWRENKSPLIKKYDNYRAEKS